MWSQVVDDWKTPVEYIDREAANLALAEQGFDWDKVKQALASVPAADVAPVVRCKDCTHLYGAICVVCGLLPRNPNDFCSYGERRDGGAE